MPALKSLARKLGVSHISKVDPEGVMATLQVGRRLVKDQGLLPCEALLEAAQKYSAANNPGRAFWSAWHALVAAAERFGLRGELDLHTSSIDELLPIFDDAIQAQGKFNMKASKTWAS